MQLLAKVYTNTGVGVPIVCRWLSVGRIWFLLVEGWLPSQAVLRALWWISTGGVVGCMIDAAGCATDLCGLAQDWSSPVTIPSGGQIQSSDCILKTHKKSPLPQTENRKLSKMYNGNGMSSSNHDCCV